MNRGVQIRCAAVHRGHSSRTAAAVRTVTAPAPAAIKAPAADAAVAPLVSLAPTGLYDFLQACFGFYNVPILASVIVGIYSKKVPALAPKVGLIAHVVLYSISKVLPLKVHYLYVLFVLFLFNIALQLFIGKIRPRAAAYVIEDAKVVDMTPWKYGKLTAAVIILLMAGMYLVFSPAVLG